MYNSNGFWLFHRKIWDNPLFRGHPNRIVIWAWMLSEAQWESGRKEILGGETITLLPGQFTCGSKQIAQITGVPRGTVERIRKLFKSEELIEERTDHQKTLITVKKWNEYQKLEERFEERVRNDRGTSEDTVIKELKELKEEVTLSVATSSPTPKEIAKDFFSDTGKQETIALWLISKGVSEDVAKREVSKFVDYWTEPTLSGKKVRWEIEKVFDIRRRFGNWMKNTNNFNRMSARSNEPKGIRI